VTVPVILIPVLEAATVPDVPGWIAMFVATAAAFAASSVGALTAEASPKASRRMMVWFALITACWRLQTTPRS
jgi:hypothetical protein